MVKRTTGEEGAGIGTGTDGVSGIEAEASGATGIDPVTLDTDNADRDDGSEYARDADGTIKRNKDGSPRKKRGRKPGSGSGATPGQKAHTLNLGGVEAILLSIHGMLAAATGAPELALDKDEAKQLSAAIAEVSKFYDATIDPKTFAWFNLLAVIGMIYGPRLYMIRARVIKEKANSEKDNSDRSPPNLELVIK